MISLFRGAGLPRGIPAASLKPEGARATPAPAVGLPRGIPAASLKPGIYADHEGARQVFRGEYPRPH